MSLPLSRFPLKFAACIVFACALLSFVKPVLAIPVSDFRAEDALPILEEVKKNLSLSANQQLLWQQTEAKVRTIIRTREARRRNVQESIKNGMQNKNTELRDLAKVMDQDELISLQENQQLRELWMTMHDALDDKQHEIVMSLLMEQLTRVADQPKDSRGGGDGQKQGGGRRGGKGGPSGQSGSGMPGGSGGMNQGGPGAD